MNYFELHQESLHCHPLEEELDDWCHCWHFQNGIGLSCRSPDSWCRRLNVVNASLKSERLLSCPDLPELFREIHQFFVYRKHSACVIWCLKTFCASSFILIQTSSSRSCSSWDARNSGSFTMTIAMRSSLLNDIIWDWEKVHCTLNGPSVGFTFYQEMPAGATDDAWTSIQWALFALRFRFCLEQCKTALHCPCP